MKTLITALFILSFICSSCDDMMTGNKFNFDQTPANYLTTQDGQFYQQDAPAVSQYESYISIYTVTGNDTLFVSNNFHLVIPESAFPISLSLWTSPIASQNYEIKIISTWSIRRPGKVMRYSIKDRLTNKIESMFTLPLNSQQQPDKKIGTYHRSETDAILIEAMTTIPTDN